VHFIVERLGCGRIVHIIISTRGLWKMDW